MTQLAVLLERLFPDGRDISVDGDFIDGSASVGGQRVAVVGTANDAAIGVELALAMATSVLATVRDHPGRAIVFLVDTQGQRLRHRDELLGIHACMAHLAQCLEAARLGGHRLVSVVYGRAVSGGYITGGMMADACFALASAEISVMNLPAMARVTKIPEERLAALSQTSPVFAPGAANYVAMGGLDATWDADPAADLAAALFARADEPGDHRRAIGRARGGRTKAAGVAARVRHDVV